MRNGFAWLTICFSSVLLSTVSCGKDEATGSDTPSGHTAHCKGCAHTSDCANGMQCKVVAGSLGVCATLAEDNCCDGPDGKSGNCYTDLGANVDGSGGSGGSILNNGGKAGKATSAGSGGSGAGPSISTRLGQNCVTDTDCGAGSGLTCVVSNALDGGFGPGRGLCTIPCNPASNQCLEVSDNAYCYPLLTGQNYCIEGCLPGQDGVPKCHEREEVACSLIGLIPRDGADCTSSDECLDGELCSSDEHVCGEIVTGCVPVCGGDYDCADGQHCDFLTGLCSDTAPDGLPLGSFCDPTDDPDPCNGFCLGGSEPDEGECSALCTLTSALSGCGWEKLEDGPAKTACLFATRVSGADTAPGDVGLCGTLCDCNSECQLTGDVCIDESVDSMTGEPAHLVRQFWGREGYCRPLASDETIANSIRICPDGSSGGGEGGQPGSGGGSGKGGSSGDSGAGGQGGA
jgi:hypothetical protein